MPGDVYREMIRLDSLELSRLWCWLMLHIVEHCFFVSFHERQYSCIRDLWTVTLSGPRIFRFQGCDNECKYANKSNSWSFTRLCLIHASSWSCHPCRQILLVNSPSRTKPNRARGKRLLTTSENDGAIKLLLGKTIVSSNYGKTALGHIYCLKSQKGLQTLIN